MRLLKATYKKDENWYGLLVGLDDGEIKGEDSEQVWMTTTARVVKYAQNQIEEESEVEIDYDYDEDDGYFANRITKVGRSSRKGSGRKSSRTGGRKSGGRKSSGHTCEDCGAELKSDKYDKCYDCNQKARKTSGGKKTSTRTYDDGERRNKLSVLSTAAEAVAINQQGRIEDIDTLIEQITTVYDNLYKHVFGG